MRALECFHPLGPYIHIVMPNEKILLRILLEAFELKDIVDGDLVKLEKLASAKNPADKCTAYKLAFLEEDAWAIVALRARINSTYSVRALFIRVDPESEVPGFQVAELMRIELAKAMVKYGEEH